MAQSPLGGDFILNKCGQILEEQLNIEVVPYYQVKSKVSLKFIYLILSDSLHFFNWMILQGSD